MTTVLITHPNHVTAQRLARMSCDWGHRTLVATDAAHALATARQHAPDVAFVGAGDDTATADCTRALVEAMRTRVVALTPNADAHKQLEAAGAVVAVPPRAGRMVMKRAMRRALHETRLAQRLYKTPSVRLGAFTHIPIASVAWMADGRGMCLTPIENALLRVLTQTPGEVVLHQDLIDLAWPDRRGRKVYRKTLQTHIYNLRRKFESYGPEAPTIELSLFQGYRFVPKGSGKVEVIKRIRAAGG